MDSDNQIKHFHRVIEALLIVDPGYRLTLNLVAIEERIASSTLHHSGQLPCQVLHVTNTGIQTKATGGRYSVCRVAGEEDPALAIRFGYLCRHDPRTDIFDGCLWERLSNCPFNESEAFFVGVVFSVFKLGVPVVHQHPGFCLIVGDQRTTDAGLEQEVEQAPFSRCDGAKI